MCGRIVFFTLLILINLGCDMRGDSKFRNGGLNDKGNPDQGNVQFDCESHKCMSGSQFCFREIDTQSNLVRAECRDLQASCASRSCLFDQTRAAGECGSYFNYQQQDSKITV